MKKKVLIFSAILVGVIIIAYFIWFFIGFSNASSSQDNYLEGLESKSEVVIEHFRDKNIIIDYSAQSHTFTVKEKDITYSFTDDGLSEIDTTGALITINGRES